MSLTSIQSSSSIAASCPPTGTAYSGTSRGRTVERSQDLLAIGRSREERPSPKDQVNQGLENRELLPDRSSDFGKMIAQSKRSYLGAGMVAAIGAAVGLACAAAAKGEEVVEASENEISAAFSEQMERSKEMLSSELDAILESDHSKEASERQQTALERLNSGEALENPEDAAFFHKDGPNTYRPMAGSQLYFEEQIKAEKLTAYLMDNHLSLPSSSSALNGEGPQGSSWSSEAEAIFLADGKPIPGTGVIYNAEKAKTALLEAHARAKLNELTDPVEDTPSKPKEPTARTTSTSISLGILAGALGVSALSGLGLFMAGERNKKRVLSQSPKLPGAQGSSQRAQRASEGRTAQEPRAVVQRSVPLAKPADSDTNASPAISSSPKEPITGFSVEVNFPRPAASLSTPSGSQLKTAKGGKLSNPLTTAQKRWEIAHSALAKQENVRPFIDQLESAATPEQIASALQALSAANVDPKLLASYTRIELVKVLSDLLSEAGVPEKKAKESIERPYKERLALAATVCTALEGREATGKLNDSKLPAALEAFKFLRNEKLPAELPRVKEIQDLLVGASGQLIRGTVARLEKDAAHDELAALIRTTAVSGLSNVLVVPDTGLKDLLGERKTLARSSERRSNRERLAEVDKELAYFKDQITVSHRVLMHELQKVCDERKQVIAQCQAAPE